MIDDFAANLRGDLDEAHGLGGEMGLRPFTVTIRQRTWTGGRPGAPGSTPTNVDTVLTNASASGAVPVCVKQVSRAEVFASGGQLRAGDWRVGPISSKYVADILRPAGGFDDTTLNPVPGANQAELIWIMTSNDGGTHGLPPGGVVCELKGQESKVFGYYVILRSTGRAPT